VLGRFEGFPVKKLETLRTAAALYSKLDAIVTELHSWKIVAPLGKLLDKVECYFTKVISVFRVTLLCNVISSLLKWVKFITNQKKKKSNLQIKGEVDAMERTKDEESKKFQSHNIDFDFHILVRIKEAIVDVSSSCMELALKVVQSEY
jgi:hypothetical protein